MDELLERLRAAVPGMVWKEGQRRGAEGSLGVWLCLSVRSRETRIAGRPVTAFDIRMSIDDDAGVETTAIGPDVAVAKIVSIIRDEADDMKRRAQVMLAALASVDPNVETESEATENRAT